MILKLINSSFHINDKTKFNELIFYIKRTYYDFLVKSSPTIAIVGYDEEFENPTFVKYNILFNNGKNLEIRDEYSVCDCASTMVFSIADDEDIILNLTGFNNQSYNEIRSIIFNLINKYFNTPDDETINQIEIESL